MNERELAALRRTARDVQAFNAKLPTDLVEPLADYFEAQRIAVDNIRLVTSAWAHALENIRQTIAGTVKAFGGAALRQTLTRIGETFRDVKAALPPNWPSGVDFEQVIDLAKAGIPTVWLPNSDLLEKLLELQDPDLRALFKSRVFRSATQQRL